MLFTHANVVLLISSLEEGAFAGGRANHTLNEKAAVPGPVPSLRARRTILSIICPPAGGITVRGLSAPRHGANHQQFRQWKKRLTGEQRGILRPSVRQQEHGIVPGKHLWQTSCFPLSGRCTRQQIIIELIVAAFLQQLSTPRVSSSKLTLVAKLSPANPSCKHRREDSLTQDAHTAACTHCSISSARIAPVTLVDNVGSMACLRKNLTSCSNAAALCRSGSTGARSASSADDIHRSGCLSCEVPLLSEKGA